MFWLLVVAGMLGGATLGLRYGRSVVVRISANSPHTRRVHRAGQIAGTVALVPALILAIFIGGNFGGALAAGFARHFSESPLIQQIIMGTGIGGGGFGVLFVLVVSTMTAGAMFMKVHLARGP